MAVDVSGRPSVLIYTIKVDTQIQEETSYCTDVSSIPFRFPKCQMMKSSPTKLVNSMGICFMFQEEIDDGKQVSSR